MFWYGGSLCKVVFEMGLNRLCVSWCPSYCTAWIISGTWSVVSFAILEPKSRNFAFYACQNFRSWYFVSETDRECSVSHFNSFHDNSGTILSSLFCLRKHQFRLAVRPPRETSPAAKSEAVKRVFSRATAFCTNRPACTIAGGGLVWTVHRHHQGLSVLTLDRGTPPWIDPTGVCSAWLILTLQVQTVLWDRFSILFLGDPVCWSIL